MALIVSFILYQFTATNASAYWDIDTIHERLVDDGYAHDATLNISGTGADSFSNTRMPCKNPSLALHNDRLLMIAKTDLNWDDFANFTKHDKTCAGHESIEELVAEGKRTGAGVPRAQLRFLLSQYVADRLRYTN